MKKKIFYWTIVGILLLGLCGAITYSIVYHDDEQKKDEPIASTSVEDLIDSDMGAMDSIANEYKFFESRVVLKDAFNKSDTFAVEEVTNVFQTEEEKGTDIVTTVYMYIHNLSNGETNVEVHKDAFITDDIELNMDSIPVTFDKAFTLARQSNYPPSKSKYITLRHGFASHPCNTFYTIGNDEMGHLWVDAITGNVTNTDPAK